MAYNCLAKGGYNMETFIVYDLKKLLHTMKENCCINQTKCMFQLIKYNVRFGMIKLVAAAGIYYLSYSPWWIAVR